MAQKILNLDNFKGELPSKKLTDIDEYRFEELAEVREYLNQWHRLNSNIEENGDLVIKIQLVEDKYSIIFESEDDAFLETLVKVLPEDWDIDAKLALKIDVEEVQAPVEDEVQA